MAEHGRTPDCMVMVSLNTKVRLSWVELGPLLSSWPLKLPRCNSASSHGSIPTFPNNPNNSYFVTSKTCGCNLGASPGRLPTPPHIYHIIYMAQSILPPFPSALLCTLTPGLSETPRKRPAREVNPCLSHKDKLAALRWRHAIGLE